MIQLVRSPGTSEGEADEEKERHTTRRQVIWGREGGLYNELMVALTFDGLEWFVYTENDPDGQPDRERLPMHAAEYVPRRISLEILGVYIDRYCVARGQGVGNHQAGGGKGKGKTRPFRTSQDEPNRCTKA